MRRLLLIAVLLSVSQFVGCAGMAAFGRTEDYRNVWPAISGLTALNIGVMVVDERPYVVSHDKSGSVVGVMRAVLGNSFDVTTSSGLPLSRDIEEAVTKGLKNAGIRANVALPPNLTETPIVVPSP